LQYCFSPVNQSCLLIVGHTLHHAQDSTNTDVIHMTSSVHSAITNCKCMASHVH